MNAPFTVAPAATPAEVELEFEVTIVPHGPVHLLSPDGRTALAELMERAQGVAQAALAGASPPMPAALAAAVAVTIRCRDAVGRCEAALARAVNSTEEQAYEAAQLTWTAASEEFEAAFDTLKTRFEKEFPHGSHQ